MAGEPYDWARDTGLDFPDDPQAEPTIEEVQERIAYYERTSWYFPDESDGFRHG